MLRKEYFHDSHFSVRIGCMHNTNLATGSFEKSYFWSMSTSYIRYYFRKNHKHLQLRHSLNITSTKRVLLQQLLIMIMCLVSNLDLIRFSPSTRSKWHPKFWLRL